MSSRTSFALLALLFAAAPFACNKPTEPAPLANIEKDYDRPLPPGQFALRQVTEPSKYPNFGDGWFRAKGIGLRQAVQNSLSYLKKPSSRNYYPMGPITHERATNSLIVFLDVLEHADSPDALNRLIADNFDVYESVGCDNEGTVLFTGYYTPIFDGSKERTDQFQYPLYGLPKEIEKDADGNVIGGPWKTRQDIETSGCLAGSEIVWLKDRFEAYVVSVQGSGFLRMADGSLYEIGYSGNNGHDYTPIARMMIADGKIERRKLSLDTMIAYFKEHPEELEQYMFQNQRYIFFQDSTGGPYGCLGQPVTAFCSIATDKDIFPRACLGFVNTRIPLAPSESMRRFRTFVLDQDRGAAIRAPGRSDIYMGVGDEAGKLAGFTYSEGGLYYIFVKEGVKPPTPADQMAKSAPDNGTASGESTQTGGGE